MPIDGGLRAHLLAGLEAGRAAHGPLGIAPEACAVAVVAGCVRRRGARGLPVDAATLSTVVPRLALDDLYLTHACDAGADAAWARLRDLFAPRLAGLVRAREGPIVDAVSAVDEFLSELALPPEASPARTRLGTYDGSGPLWSWLAAGLVHRLLRRGRDRLRPVGDALDDRQAAPAEPAAAIVDAEEALALDRGLAEGWRRLEPLERLAVVWKHRHGLPQRRIAALLGLGEDRVSRLLDRAIAKLRGAVAPTLGASRGEHDTPGWAALVARLSEHLARVDVDPIPDVDAPVSPRVTG